MKEHFGIIFVIYTITVIAIIAWLGFLTLTTRKEMRAFNAEVTTAIRTMDGALGGIYKNDPSLFVVDKKEEGNNKK